MEVWIDNSPAPLVIGAKGIEDILQCVRMILLTPKGSVPLDRDFGIDWSLIDKPAFAVNQLLKAHIAEQIHKYEPRAKVKKVEMGSGELPDGKLKVKVLIEVREDENG